MNYKTPTELVDYLLKVSYDKGNKAFYKLVILGFLGGMFIALGAVGNIIVSSSLIKSNVGGAKYLGASVFPVGLIMIVVLGAELFTSNTLIFTGVLNKKISVNQMLYNWITIYLANFLGALFVSYITIKTHNFNNESMELLKSIAEHKTHAEPYLIFLKGILCNVLVCGAVLAAYCSKDIIGRIFAIWFPIMLFIILGYDHCIANMFYLTAAKFGGVDITFAGMGKNLLFATIGNIVGGSLLIGTSLYITYFKKSE